MADIVIVNGKPIAADQITDPDSVATGTYVERVKLGYGANDTYVDVTDTTPIPVSNRKSNFSQGATYSVDSSLIMLLSANPARMNVSIINTSTDAKLFIVFADALSGKPDWYSMVLYPEERYWSDPLWAGEVYGYSEGAPITTVVSEYWAG